MNKLWTCIWFDHGQAVEAANFYASTFPNSAVIQINSAPSDFPGGKQGVVLTVEFTVLGHSMLGINGGPAFKHSEAMSFMVLTDDQAQTDHYWNAIVSNDGFESACGWCKDKWGISWQITPKRLLELTTSPDQAVAKRAFDAMMKMTKINIAELEAAVSTAMD